MSWVTRLSFNGENDFAGLVSKLQSKRKKEKGKAVEWK